MEGLTACPGRQVLTRESREDLVEACHEHLRVVGVDMRVPGKVPLEKCVRVPALPVSDWLA